MFPFQDNKKTSYREIVHKVGLQGGTGRGCTSRVKAAAIGVNSSATGNVPCHINSVTFSAKLLKWSLDVF